MDVVDNILSPSLFAKLSATIVEGNIPYIFAESTAFGYGSKKGYDFSWSHMVYDDGQALSGLCNFLETVFLVLMDNSNQTATDLYRIRLGLITQTHKNITHDAHIDYDQPHKTGLLYLNDTDGDTYIYSEKYDSKSNIHSQEYLKSIGTLHIQKAVACKSNRFVSFDGFNYHSSNSPTNSAKRIVITFNYT